MTSLRTASVLVLLFAVGCISICAAPMACPLSTLNQYDQPGFSCIETINGVDFTFKSFTFMFQGPSGSGGLSDSQITVQPLEGINMIGLQFFGNFFADDQILTYKINYIIDPPPPIIRGEQIDVDPATLTTTLCPALNMPPACPPGAPLILTATTASPTASVTFPFPVNVLGVQNTFVIDGTAFPASAGGFDNRTLLLPPPYPPAVPEPASTTLTTVGLFGLLAFRSRAKLHKILLELGS